MSIQICFVCGSNGGESVLHIKPREKGSYFPFLEHHDPPKRAKLPSSDGTVLSCRVCHAMLNGQWDSFERTKTPAIKRHYWLKRCDNGQFTGAEMRIQGEYAAQVMGLQYTPGSFGGASGFTEYATPMSSPATPAFTSRQPSPKKAKYDQATVSDVLDLSVSTSTSKSRLVNVGSTKKSKKADVVRDADVTQGKDSGTIICFICGSEQPCSLGRYIFSKKSVDGEPFFPFLERIRPPKGAMALTAQGLTRVCSNCRSTLSRQWKVYDASNTPDQSRIYRINNEPIAIFSRPELEELPQKNLDVHMSEEVMEFQEVCFLCGQVYHRDSMKLLYTRPPKENSKHSMYFPFVAKLQKHAKAKAIDMEGRVTSCRACYSYLQRQWQNYQSEGIPAKDREFVLRPLTKNPKDESSGKSTPKRSHPSGENGEVNQPLNIQISSSGPLFGVPAPGLLAIASGITPQMMMGMIPIHPAMYQQYQQQLAAAAVHSSMGNQNSTQSSVSADDKQDKEIPKCDIRNRPEIHVQNKTIPEFPPKSSKGTWCYLCGFKCTGDKFYSVKTTAFKQNESTVSPYFPFLRRKDPAPRAEKMSPDGKVKTCRYCYYTLLYQWNTYEKSKETKGQYDRKYSVDTFVCFVCARSATRKNTRTVDLRYFPELVERNRPFGSLVMKEECSVAVCVNCEQQLAIQYSEFEEKKIAVGQRLYRMSELSNDCTRTHTSGTTSNGILKHSSQVCNADPKPVNPDSYLPKYIDFPTSLHSTSCHCRLPNF